MFCPKCSTIDDKVIDSRLSREGHSIRRRRECLGCGHRFTTYEEIERMELLAVKRDGRREILDRKKLLSSFMKACEKRPIALETMELLVETILQDLDSLQQREIPTKLIGDKVMKQPDIFKFFPESYFFSGFLNVPFLRLSSLIPSLLSHHSHPLQFGFFLLYSGFVSIRFIADWVTLNVPRSVFIPPSLVIVPLYTIPR